MVLGIPNDSAVWNMNGLFHCAKKINTNKLNDDDWFALPGTLVCIKLFTAPLQSLEREHAVLCRIKYSKASTCECMYWSNVRC